MKLTIPAYVKTVMDVLQARGFQAHVVGGAVRDMLLGRTPDDYDVVTNARPEEIIRTAEDAALYYTIVEEILGKEWLTTELFRIGASSAANNILSAIEGSEIKYF